MAQGLVSLFHFALNIFLLDRLVQVEYGTFALGFAIALIASAVTNAMYTVPMSVYRPAAQSDAQRARVDAVLNRGASATTGAAIAIGVLWSVISAPEGALMVALGATLFIATYSLRQHGRGARYSGFDAAAVLRGDVAYIATSLIALVVLGQMMGLSAAVALVALSIGNVISLLALLEFRSESWQLDGTLRDAYSVYWPDVKWTLVGAVSTMVVAQGHSVIVSALRDPATLAPLAAGFVVFGPVRVLFSTIQNVLRPEIAKALADRLWSSARNQAILASGASLAGVLFVTAALFVFWEPISARLYDEQYADEPMVAITLMWAVASAAAGLGSGASALLQAMRRFRELALVGLGAGLLLITVIPVILSVTSAEFSILGVAGAESAMMVGMLMIARRQQSVSVEREPVTQ